jgi:hypothetical protein
MEFEQEGIAIANVRNRMLSPVTRTSGPSAGFAFTYSR